MMGTVSYLEDVSRRLCQAPRFDLQPRFVCLLLTRWFAWNLSETQFPEPHPPGAGLGVPIAVSGPEPQCVAVACRCHWRRDALWCQYGGTTVRCGTRWFGVCAVVAQRV